MANNTVDFTGYIDTILYEHYHEKMRNLEHVTLGIVTMIICIVGMVANSINIIGLSLVIRRSKLPVYRCFLGLAIADFMVVFFSAIINGHFYLIKADIMLDEESAMKRLSVQHSNRIFYLFPHLINISMAASNWCVVSMSLLRCIAVFFPLWYQRYCTTKVVNSIIVLVYIFSVVINIPSMLAISYNAETHLFKSLATDHIDKLGFNPAMFSLIVIQVIPMLMTTSLLVPLIWKLSTRPPIERSASNVEYRAKEKLHTSITLLCISGFFVLCISPIMIWTMRQMLQSEPLTDFKEIYQVHEFYVAANIVMDVNYTANFCFYILLNSRLRRKLKFILGCSKGREADTGRNFTCITQQSSLSGIRRFSGEPMTGDHNSTVGWSNRVNANGKQRKSIDKPQELPMSAQLR